MHRISQAVMPALAPISKPGWPPLQVIYQPQAEKGITDVTWRDTAALEWEDPRNRENSSESFIV
jgi:hypothetical protein